MVDVEREQIGLLKAFGYSDLEAAAPYLRLAAPIGLLGALGGRPAGRSGSASAITGMLHPVHALSDAEPRLLLAGLRRARRCLDRRGAARVRAGGLARGRAQPRRRHAAAAPAGLPARPARAAAAHRQARPADPDDPAQPRALSGPRGDDGAGPGRQPDAAGRHAVHVPRPRLRARPRLLPRPALERGGRLRRGARRARHRRPCVGCRASTPPSRCGSPRRAFGRGGRESQDRRRRVWSRGADGAARSTPPAAGIPFEGRGVILSEALARKLGRRGPATSSTWRSPRPPARARSLPVTATAEDYSGLTVYMARARAQPAAGRGRRGLGRRSSWCGPPQRPAFYRAIERTPQIVARLLARRHRGRLAPGDDRGVPDHDHLLRRLRRAIAFGVAFNIGRIALAERSRDLATLHVLGFDHRECAYILLGELLALALLAVPLGMLGGNLLRRGPGARPIRATSCACRPPWRPRATASRSPPIFAAVLSPARIVGRRDLDARSRRRAEDEGMRRMSRTAIRWIVIAVLVARASRARWRCCSRRGRSRSTPRASPSARSPRPCRTRARRACGEAYVVAAPVSGRLERVDLHVGDRVIAGRTVIARLRPAPPDLLDPRARAQAQAAVPAASAAVSAAPGARASGWRPRPCRADLALARMRTLAERGFARQAGARRRRGRGASARAGGRGRRRRSRCAAGPAGLGAVGARSGPGAAARGDRPGHLAGDRLRHPRAAGERAHRRHGHAAGRGRREPGPRGPDRVPVAGRRADPPRACRRRSTTGAARAHPGDRPPGRAARASSRSRRSASRSTGCWSCCSSPARRPLGQAWGRATASGAGCSCARSPRRSRSRSARWWDPARAGRCSGSRAAARLTPVSVGAMTDREAEIRAGLSAGDLVVLFPSDRVRDRVRLAPRSPSP